MVFCIFALHLLILSWTAVELSRRQGSDWHTHTHGHTDRHTEAGDDNTRRPKLASGKNAVILISAHYSSDQFEFKLLQRFIQNLHWVHSTGCPPGHMGKNRSSTVLCIRSHIEDWMPEQRNGQFDDTSREMASLCHIDRSSLITAIHHCCYLFGHELNGLILNVTIILICTTCSHFY